MAKKYISHKPFLKKITYNQYAFFFAITLLNLLAYHLLLKYKIFDETMLFSWNWMVNYLNIKLFFTLLILFSITSMLIARIDFKVKEKPFLIFVFILAFLLSSFTWSAPTPNPDIAEFYGVAKYIKLHGIFDYLKSFGTSELAGYRFHSLLPIIGLAFRYFGESPFVVHLIMSAIYAFIPVLTFLLSKNIFNKKIACISSLLTISIPIMLIQSSMFLVDVATVFAVLLALLTFYEFLHKKKLYYYPLTVLVLLFALTIKRPAILFLLLSMIVLFIHVIRTNKSKLKHVSMKSFIIFYIVFVIALSFIFLKLNFFSDQLALDLSSANISGNPNHYVGSLSYFFQIQPLMLICFLIFLVLFAFKPKVSYLFLIAWIIFPFIFITGTTLRYMMPAFPGIAISAAILISKFKKPVITFLVSLFILSSTLIFVMGYLPLANNEFYDSTIKDSADYVNSLDIDTVGVYMFYNDTFQKHSPKTEIYGYVFDYYSNDRIFYGASESTLPGHTSGFKAFQIFEYYKDDNYLSPGYDVIVVFSDIYEYAALQYNDVNKIEDAISSSYSLSKSISTGNSGIEKNKFSFIYLRS